MDKKKAKKKALEKIIGGNKNRRSLAASPLGREQLSYTDFLKDTEEDYTDIQKTLIKKINMADKYPDDEDMQKEAKRAQRQFERLKKRSSKIADKRQYKYEKKD